MTTTPRSASDAGQTETSSTARDVPLLTAYHAQALVLYLGDADPQIGAALRAIASGASRVVPSRTGEGEKSFRGDSTALRGSHPAGVRVFVVFGGAEHDGYSTVAGFLTEADAIAFRDRCIAYENERPRCPPYVHGEADDARQPEWDLFDKAGTAWNEAHPAGIVGCYAKEYHVGELLVSGPATLPPLTPAPATDSRSPHESAAVPKDEFIGVDTQGYPMYETNLSVPMELEQRLHAITKDGDYSPHDSLVRWAVDALVALRVARQEAQPVAWHQGPLVVGHAPGCPVMSAASGCNCGFGSHAAPAPEQGWRAPDYQEIVQAVARGWCHKVTENKVMDPVLAMAIANEVFAAMKAAPPEGEK